MASVLKEIICVCRLRGIITKLMEMSFVQKCTDISLYSILNHVFVYFIFCLVHAFILRTCTDIVNYRYCMPRQGLGNNVVCK